MREHCMRIIKRLAYETVIVIVAAVLVLSAIKIQRSFHAHAKQLTRGAKLSEGARPSIRNVDFKNAPLSLLLLGSPTCSFCVQSSQFHKRLLANANQHHIPFFVAVPDHQARNLAYAQALGFSESAIKNWSDLGFRVDGTPTLLAIDSHGSIFRSWVGRLSPEAEKEKGVFQVVRQRPSDDKRYLSDDDDVERVSLQQLKNQSNYKWQIIDARERNTIPHLAEDLRIPFAELPFRARYELFPENLQVVDCYMSPASFCRDVTHFLNASGYRVALLSSSS